MNLNSLVWVLCSNESNRSFLLERECHTMNDSCYTMIHSKEKKKQKRSVPEESFCWHLNKKIHIPFSFPLFFILKLSTERNSSTMSYPTNDGGGSPSYVTTPSISVSLYSNRFSIVQIIDVRF
jgi:hypothetical protein